MFSGLAEREEIALGRLVEDVVDHLHGVDQAGADDLERGIGLVVVDRDADGADFAGALQIVEGAAPVVVVDPLGVPDVELQQVDGVELEVVEALLGARHDVVVREDFGDRRAALRRPDAVLRRDFRRDVDLFARRVAHDLADEALAVAVAIGERGVDQVEAELDGAAQGADAIRRRCRRATACRRCPRRRSRSR